MTVLAYLFLALAAVLLLAVTWRSDLTAVRICLFVVAGASVGSADMLVHAIGHMYIFHPGLMPVLAADGPLGLILAEYLFVPSLASLLANIGRQYRWTAALAISLGVVAIEDTFVRMGALEHRSWVLAYSILLFPIYFSALAWLATYVETHGFDRLVQVLTIGSTLLYLDLLWSASTGFILGFGSYQLGWLASFPDAALGFLLGHGLPVVTAGFLAIWRRWTVRLSAYLVLVAAFSGWFWWLRQAGIMVTPPFWSPVAEAVSVGMLILAADTLYRWVTRHSPLRTG